MGRILKPYAMAAAKTLKGLLRPVCLESDGAIDISSGAVPPLLLGITASCALETASHVGRTWVCPYRLLFE